MTIDLVERLNRHSHGMKHERPSTSAMCAEAAAEITRLRGLVEEARGVLGQLAEPRSVTWTGSDEEMAEGWRKHVLEMRTAASSLLPRLK